jgi:hypothetical protein
MFLWHVGELLPDYTVSHLRKQYSLHAKNLTHHSAPNNTHPATILSVKSYVNLKNKLAVIGKWKSEYLYRFLYCNVRISPSTKSVLLNLFRVAVVLSWIHRHHRRIALKLSQHEAVSRPAQYSWRNLNGHAPPQMNIQPCVQRGPTPVNNRMDSNLQLIYIALYVFLST